MSLVRVILMASALVALSTAVPLFGPVQYVATQPSSAGGGLQPASNPLGLPPFFNLNTLLTAPNQVFSQISAAVSPSGGTTDPLSRLIATPVSFAQSALGQMNGMFGPEGQSAFIPDLSHLSAHPVANMTGAVFQQIAAIPAGLLQQVPLGGLQPQHFGMFGQQQQQQLPMMLPSFPAAFNFLQPYPSAAVVTPVATTATPAVVAAPVVPTTTTSIPPSVAETSGEAEATSPSE